MSMQPPPINQLPGLYMADPKSEHLRFGQWFFNRYLAKVEGKDIDELYNSDNIGKCLSIIRKYYEYYQWELT